MAETIYDSIYPLTITSDRYGGAYSGGDFLAWKLLPENIPTEPWEDDVTCYEFWHDTDIICGRGKTPEEAVANLYIMLRGDGNG